MKKIYYIYLILLLIPLNVYAKKEKVTLDKCIDGDTVTIIKDKEKIKVRMLSIDTPEIDKNEPYSTEAKNYTCDLLKNSKNIYIEKDNKSDEYDKYERFLAWIWADDKLVQKELVKNGYAKVAYTYDEYKYTSELREYEKNAKDNKLNIWNDYKKKKNTNIIIKKKKINIYLDRLIKHYEVFALFVGMILALITYSKTKKKNINKKRR